MRRFIRESIQISAAFILMVLPLLGVAAVTRPEKAHSAGGMRFEDSDWVIYRNEQQGYRLKLPPQLQENFKKYNNMQWAVENRMPFDYVNFGPKQASAGFETFELGVGVHWNRDKLGTREFADKKDEGLKMSGGRIVTIRQTEVSVAGIKGVRDDFRLKQPYGWSSYSRVIIPCKDRFFVFLGTLGSDIPLPEYERLFQKIVDSFEIIDEGKMGSGIIDREVSQ